MAVAAVRLPAKRFSCESQQVWHVSLGFAALLFNRAALARITQLLQGQINLPLSSFAIHCGVIAKRGGTFYLQLFQSSS